MAEPIKARTLLNVRDLLGCGSSPPVTSDFYLLESVISAKKVWALYISFKFRCFMKFRSGMWFYVSLNTKATIFCYFLINTILYVYTRSMIVLKVMLILMRQLFVMVITLSIWIHRYVHLVYRIRKWSTYGSRVTKWVSWNFLVRPSHHVLPIYN